MGPSHWLQAYCYLATQPDVTAHNSSACVHRYAASGLAGVGLLSRPISGCATRPNAGKPARHNSVVLGEIGFGRMPRVG